MRPLLSGILLILALFAVNGCGDDSDQFVAVEDPNEWIWVGEDFVNESTEKTFTWNSSLSGVVRMEFKGDPLTGTVRIRVFDGNGEESLDEEFSGSEVDLRESEFTHPTVAGLWHVKIDLEGVTGDLRVIIDDRL